MSLESVSQSLAVSAGEISLQSPERQALVVVQDDAGFVNRGLAILWRDADEGGQTAHYAEACTLIEHDDLAGLEPLLHVHPRLVAQRGENDEGLQLLHVAARRGSIACIGLLVEHGAVLDSPSGQLQADVEGFRPGATPLLIATDMARTDAAVALLEAGADANACLPGGESVLQMAAARGLLTLVEALINAGAKIDVLSSWYSYDDQLGTYCGNGVLHVAALSDRAEIVRLLLKAGAERDICGADLRTPLHYAAARGCVAAVETLLAAGADPDALDICELDGLTTRMSPLHYAVINGHLAVAAMLLCYGANPALIETGSGESAVQMAERSEDPQLVSLLVRAWQGAVGESVFSHLDDQYITCLPATYTELRAFLLNLLSEFPVGSKSLLVLSDWLAEMLGAENRPHLVRAYRESLNKGAN